MTGEFVAAAGGTVEFGGHLVGKPFPVAAEVGFASCAADGSGWDGRVSVLRLCALLVGDDGFDVFADGSELGVSQSC